MYNNNNSYFCTPHVQSYYIVLYWPYFVKLILSTRIVSLEHLVGVYIVFWEIHDIEF